MVSKPGQTKLVSQQSLTEQMIEYLFHI
uniref:Uncharacterized protein n=1 Tax=Arundo donax TaxID=35708 RepID=A0A0A9D8A5_ARUDO